MILPNWRLHQLNRLPKGERLGLRPKLPVAQVPDNESWPCGSCLRPVMNIRLNGAVQLNGIYRDGKRWHYQCAPFPGGYTSPNPGKSDGPAITTNQLANQWRALREERQRVPDRGNLNEAEYRYWFGCRAKDVQYSKCRACGTMAHSSEERLAHFKDARYLVGMDACTTQLTRAYRNMLAKNEDMCIVCKGRRFKHQKWGVPICQRVDCINDWKFSQGRYMPLEVELKRQKTAAKKESIVSSNPDVKPDFRMEHYNQMERIKSLKLQ